MVAFNTGDKAQPVEFEVVRQYEKFRTGIPFKLSASHYCIDNLSLKPYITVVQLSLDKESLKRFRIHFGTTDDIIFGLQTCGIYVKDNPVRPDGSISLDSHRKWIGERHEEEKDRTPVHDAIVPRRFDVLFGRGNVREHTGNLRACLLVDMFHEEYEKAGKFEKTQIAERVVGMIYDSYGRFLRWEADGWTEVDYAVARDKISHSFRHRRTKNGRSKGMKDTSNPSVRRAITNASIVDPIKVVEKILTK